MNCVFDASGVNSLKWLYKYGFTTIYLSNSSSNSRANSSISCTTHSNYIKCCKSRSSVSNIHATVEISFIFGNLSECEGGGLTEQMKYELADSSGFPGG